MFHKIMFINKKTQFCLTRKKSNNLIHIHIFHKLLFFNFLVKSFLRKKNCSKLCVDRGTTGPENIWLAGVDELSGGSCWKAFLLIRRHVFLCGCSTMIWHVSQEKLNPLQDRVTCLWRQVPVLITITFHNGWPANSLLVLAVSIWISRKVQRHTPWLTAEKGERKSTKYLRANVIVICFLRSNAIAT